MLEKNERQQRFAMTSTFFNSVKFGILITPLFETFNATVTTTDRTSFVSSVYAWLDKSCSLISLRPGLCDHADDSYVLQTDIFSYFLQVYCLNLFGIFILSTSAITSPESNMCLTAIFNIKSYGISILFLLSVVFQALRNLSTRTSILTTPKNLRQEALDDVMKTNFPSKCESS